MFKKQFDYSELREAELIDQIEETRYKENIEYFQNRVNSDLYISAKIRERFRRLSEK